MNRRTLALRLSALVTLAGLLPIAIVGVAGIELLRRRSERAALESLQAIANQTAERVSGYLAHQQELIRAVAAVAAEPDVERRLAELVLDVPSVGNVRLVTPQTPDAQRPRSLSAEALARAFAGNEVSSGMYIAQGSTPAMDTCVPARALRSGIVCAQLDLLELWRFVQRITVGDSGHALVFNDEGRLLASGAGELRAAILTGEDVPQSRFARDVARAPARYAGAGGQPVLAAWAPLPGRSWAVAVELPLAEVAQTARTAQWLLLGVLTIALLLSLGVGVLQSQRVISAMQAEERWRTAGRIASGVTHDLGHRLRILQQTAGLAEANEPAFLPQIAENLRAEVRTLQKFIADFSDLSRDVRKLEAFPLGLSTFVQSVCRTASAHATAAGVQLSVEGANEELWVSADRYLLERALLNLVSNAIEASVRGGTVTLSTGTSEAGHFIEVADSGAGISADRLERLFDAFVSTKRTGAHIGMGLANVKRIVDAHGGQVTVDSRPGEGARFRIHLQPAPAPSDAADAQSSSSSSAPGVSP